MSGPLRLERFHQGQVHEEAGRWILAETAYREAGASRARARMVRRRVEDALLTDMCQNIVAAEAAGRSNR